MVSSVKLITDKMMSVCITPSKRRPAGVPVHSITDLMIDLVVGLAADWIGGLIGCLIGYPMLMWLKFWQSGWTDTLG